MAINFTVGEFVIANQAYTKKILPTITGIRKQTLGSLGVIGNSPSEILETGMTPDAQFFIRLRPQDTTSPAFRGGNGTIIYFPNDTILNNSLERTTAYLADKCCVKALNLTGSLITKGALVYQIGFNAAQQLPTIALASGANPSTAAVLGLASADILDTECGSIIFSGSFEGLNTSIFANVGDRVFLGDPAGTFNNVAGTVEALIGRVLSIDPVNGSISLVQSLGGSGSGAMGATGLKGCTGLQGETGLGTQGVTGLALGATGIQGVTGILGIDGQTGIQGVGVTGIEGSQGVTGILGIDGQTGVQGVQGTGGITGLEGLQGLTGLALGSTGLQGDQGATGVGGGGGGSVTGAMRVIRFTVGTAATTDSVTAIPSGGRVQFCSLEITSPYDAGTLIGVGRIGFAPTYMTVSQNNPESIGANVVFNDVATVGAVRVTITGSPAAGASICTVWYAEVDV
jgi:hypothetical protein